MNKNTETLAVNLMELSDAQLANLKHHLEIGTKIICGPKAPLWSEPGCGCPATLATSRTVPEKRIAFCVPDKVYATWEKISDNTPTTSRFFDALKRSNQAQVKRAIRKVLELRGI